MDPLLLENIREIKRDLKELNNKVEELGKWKAKVIGGSLVLSFLLTMGFRLAEVLLK